MRGKKAQLQRIVIIAIITLIALGLMLVIYFTLGGKLFGYGEAFRDAFRWR